MREAIAILLMVSGLFATLGILVLGIISMARGGEFSQKWGNKLMRYRIVSQIFAILLFALGLYILKQV